MHPRVPHGESFGEPHYPQPGLGSSLFNLPAVLGNGCTFHLRSKFDPFPDQRNILKIEFFNVAALPLTVFHEAAKFEAQILKVLFRKLLPKGLPLRLSDDLFLCTDRIER